jgi:hypothetical protein
MGQTEDLANNFRVPTLRESRRLHIDTVDLNDASTLIRGSFDGKTLCQGKGQEYDAREDEPNQISQGVAAFTGT